MQNFPYSDILVDISVNIYYVTLKNYFLKLYLKFFVNKTKVIKILLNPNQKNGNALVTKSQSQ